MAEQLDLLISSAAASLARMSAPPAPAEDSRARAPGCGSRCAESCPRCGRLGLLLKTSLLYELAVATGSSKTWKRSATPHGRAWWVLTRSAHRTEGGASGSSRGFYPTATAGDYKASGSRTAANSLAHPGVSLTDVVVHGLTIKDKARRMWTTPAAHEARLGYQQRPEGMASGQDQQSLTTDVFDHDFPPDPGNPFMHGKHQEPSRMLNANWVFQLMGYPQEWARLSTERASRLPETPLCQELSRS